MKSNKQRRAEIRGRRLERAARIEAQLRLPDQRHLLSRRAPGLEPADVAVLARHNNTYGALPTYYVDRAFTCRDCGAEQVWTAKQQKWWYETMHASIDSRAVRCLPCRRALRAARSASREGEGANLLGEMSQRLRAFAGAPATPAARAEVDAALESKWWGLRTLAVEALGHWGSAADLARLRALVDAWQPSWNSWERQGAQVAAEALAAKLRHPADEDWALEACLRGHANPWNWRAFLAAIPSARLAACGEAEFVRRGEGHHRLLRWLAVAHCLGLAPGPAQVAALNAHADKEVRQWAQRFGRKPE